jgi:tetratricopeptide (TPR) repeat protein
MLADGNADRNSLERALSLAKRFENSANPTYLDTLGWIYYRLDQYDRAIPLLTRAVEANAASAVFAYHLGMALYKGGDSASARMQLRRAVESRQQFAGSEEASKILASM